MININKVILVGRLTRDVEVRKTGSGLSVAQFTVAVDRRLPKNSDGQQSADFVPCVAWRQSADFLGSYARKGNLVSVEGHIQTRNYDDKDGRKIYVAEVVCENVQLQSRGTYQDAASTGMELSSAECRQKKEDAQPNPYSMASIKAASTADPADPLNQQINDDLPF